MDFTNRKFCDTNGISFKNFAQENKKYYQEQENYDWVEVVDRFLGLEAILHRLRERQTFKLVKKYGNKGKILDAGCGTGLVLRHLPPGSVGIDINPRNIKQAKRHAPAAELILGDVEKMPFADHVFQTVICTDVFEHIVQPDKALKEIFRILRPGGILIGSVPSKNPLWHLRFLSSTHPGEPYHKLYEKEEVKSLFKNEGKILELKKGCWGMNFFFVVIHG